MAADKSSATAVVPTTRPPAVRSCPFSSFAPAGQLPQLPDGVLDRLLELTEKTPGSVALGLDDDVLTVMLCHRFVTTGDPIVRDPVTRERLEQQALPELEQVLALAAACQGVEG